MTARKPARQQPAQRKLVLYARPRIAPLHRWPHTINNDVAGRGKYVVFEWATVHANGSGWTTGGIVPDAYAFPVDDLDNVIEAFFDSVAGPYPFDFSVRLIEAHQPRSRSKAKRKTKTAKRTTAKTGLSKKRTGKS